MKCACFVAVKTSLQESRADTPVFVESVRKEAEPWEAVSVSFHLQIQCPPSLLPQVLIKMFIPALAARC